MIVTCGITTDIANFNFRLPQQVSKIAVLVSGGLDSALLYYLCQKENKSSKIKHSIVPVVIVRDSECINLAQAVVDSIHSDFSLPYVSVQIINDSSSVDEIVYNSIKKIYYMFDKIYVGLSQRSHFHRDYFFPPNIKSSSKIKFPIRKLKKYHLIDLCFQFGQENLFHLTNSCFINDIGRCHTCAGCLERKWGFDQLNKQDPGGI